MDAERFGRALGLGVRETARALLKAADAAAAPNPRPANPPSATPPEARRKPIPSTLSPFRSIPSPRDVQQGGKRFGRAVWAPAARAGGVLWHEVTGFFFGLFALTAAVELWRRRLDFAAAGPAREKACFAACMLLVFGWFTVSSFLKAHRRARRP